MKTYDKDGKLQTKKADSLGNIASYDTGWIACSDWTNQHLGSVLGGNVVHNLDAPLRNLDVKIFVSTDGSDANSFGILNFSWTVGDSSARNMGITAFEVDSNNLIIQTGAQGVNYTRDTGGYNTLETDAYYYRVVIYKMNQVYTATHLDYYETPWINRSDWTNVHMGSTVTKNVDSDVAHNLNAPLSDLMIKVLISTDGTDANSFEMVDARLAFDQAAPSAISQHYGLSIYQIDLNNIQVQTATNGMSYIQSSGVMSSLISQDWYYKIKVYKMTAVPLVAQYLQKYDTGWIACSDWTNQHLGSSLGGNVVHNLNAPMSDILIKVLISSDGTNANSFELVSTSEATQAHMGVVLEGVDDSNFIVQTGANGILQLTAAGLGALLNSQSQYYKIKVWKLG